MHRSQSTPPTSIPTSNLSEMSSLAPASLPSPTWYDSSEDDLSSSDESYDLPQIQLTVDQIIRTELMLLDFATLSRSQIQAQKRKRKATVQRDRKHPKAFVASWSDEMFKRQFRLGRQDFYELVGKIETLVPYNQQKVLNSSGSGIGLAINTTTN